MKRCSRCKQVTSDFAKDARSSSGLQSQCLPCQRERDRDRYQRHREKRKAAQAAYWASLPPDERTTRNRLYYLKLNYGLSPEQFAEMLAAQNGVCALCDKPQVGVRKNKQTLQVDHCHKTGRVRGLLCNECNTALGRLGDCEEGLLRALAYVRGEITRHRVA